MYSNDRVAARHLLRVAVDKRKRADFEGAPFHELLAVAKMLSRQVSSMDPKSVAYGTYVAAAFTGSKKDWVHALQKSLLLAYRKNLIEWMEHALVKRANLGGGGSGIKKVEKGLAAFAEAVPDIVQGKGSDKLSDYLPDTEYFVSKLLDPIGTKIINVVRSDAEKASVQKTARRSHRFTIQWDDRDRVWFIPYDNYTFDYYDQLAMDGFKVNRPKRRWEYKKKRLAPALERTYDIEGGPAPKAKPKPKPRSAPTPTPEPLATPAGGESPLHDWYFETWLPANIDRFTQVFSNFARSKQSSYSVIFSVTGRKVNVKFKRQIDTPAEAVEELRYRYTNRRGRESWLEVIDYFIKLVNHASADKGTMFLIDRINNLQHSNGLFMEHFPSNIKSWYEKFLNAKFHTPSASELAKNIPDRDLKNLFLELTHYLYESNVTRMPGFQQAPISEDYQSMTKDLEKGEDWRAKGYPFERGKKQVDRMDPRVQKELGKLKLFQDEREIRMIQDPDVLDRLMSWLPDVKKWRDQAAMPADSLTAHSKQVMQRNGISDTEIEKALAPLVAWGREFKSLMSQEPPIPKERDNLSRYQKWVQQVRNKLRERVGAEKPMKDALEAARKRSLQKQREMEDYWRETRLASNLMASLLAPEA